MTDPFRRVWLGLAALVMTLVAGTGGYVALGFGLLDAVYQTVITVTTVGFREVRALSDAGKVFTIGLVLVGTGTALYTLSVLIEALVEGQIREMLGRRRMDRQIARLEDHVIICGWGRVGRAISRYVTNSGQKVVVVDRDPERIATVPYPSVQGDVTDDTVLLRAGIERARVLVAALETDADNLFVAVSGRSLRPDLFIIARARTESSEPKLARAGANRVVNPQRIGGERMAAFALQPHVAEFLDVVMHDGSLEFRLEEVEVPAGSTLAGATLREAHVRDRTGALVLALREADGTFTTNPSPETVICPGNILIAIGTSAQLEALVDAVGAARGRGGPDSR
ncbi:MAG: potassium channel protein [Actinomycetota bacterium]|nr:potassium channel protein [Actinomycetota bacterium]